MSSRRWLAVAIGVVVALVAWRMWRAGLHPDPSSTLVATNAKALAPPAATISLPGALLADGPHLADQLDSPSGDTRTDLQIVVQLLEAFRTNFPAAGNPVGENMEITAALTGSNRLQVAFIAKTHRAINPRGELCDRWGTPFFFHQLSATEMEIRSAGPDRQLWNADDVVLTP